jgi:putative copper export protein
MGVAEVGHLLLRIAHSVAAAVWIGGGAYYLLAVRPGLRGREGAANREFASQVQREFGEWASVATLVMIATGVVLMFDRLTGGQGTALYVIMLVVKVVAAVAAFWITGALRVGRRPSGSRRSGYLDRAWTALVLSLVAFVLGAVLSTLFPADYGV